MSQIQTSSALDHGIAALIPTGNAVYNLIMGKIEPELCSGNYEYLQQKYRNETSTKYQTRLQRYQTAFAKYDQIYTAWLTNVRQAVHAKRVDAIEKAEVHVQQQDDNTMELLEQQFSI